MKYECVGVLKRDIVNTIVVLSEDNQSFWNLTDLLKLQDLIEFAAYFFEDFRSEFEQLKQLEYSMKISQEQMDIESLVFISWCSLHALYELKGIDKPKKNTDQVFPSCLYNNLSSFFSPLVNDSKKIDSIPEGRHVVRLKASFRNLFKKPKRGIGE